MSVTITIPADLEPRLRRAADAQHRPAEEVALDILRDGLRDEPDAGDALDLEAVVAAIRALPPNPVGCHYSRSRFSASHLEHSSPRSAHAGRQLGAFANNDTLRG